MFKVEHIVFLTSENSHLSKLDPRYEGPFEILQLLPNYRTEIKNLANNMEILYVIFKDINSCYNYCDIVIIIC